MRSTSHRSAAGSAAACCLAALFAVSAMIWDQDAMRDGLTDDLIGPWCRIGALDSWAGRPCVVEMHDASTEVTASSR